MKRVIELQTTGADEYLQNVGGDPFHGSGSYVGLRVPSLPSTPDNRYLFLGATFSIGEHERARILGFRQLVTIGLQQGAAASRTGDPGNIRPVEFEVTSPVFRFVDGNVSHHLRRACGPGNRGLPPVVGAPLDQRSFKAGFADGPALLYRTATIPAGAPYTQLTAYTPPNGGQPYGAPLENGLTMGSLYGLSTPWNTHGAWSSLGIDILGPDQVAWFISVKQTDPATRTALVPPTTPAVFYSNGLSPEEQFLLNFPTAIYWRVGVSLIVEFDRQGP